jgi:hypothetical protein
MADRESARKELTEQDAERVMAYFWWDIHTDLDWTKGVESLEQEFRAQAPQAEEGKPIVDKLLRAHQKRTGDARYLHVEIQAHFEAGFERRVYVYNSRAEDRFGQPVVSLVLLIDDDPKWHPSRYSADLYSTKRSLTFRSVKVMKKRNQIAKLEKDPNPVGLFVAAFLEGRRLKDDEPARAAVKVRLIRNLLGRGKALDDPRHWYQYLEWLLPLSPEYNRRVREEVDRTRKEGEMRFRTYADDYVEGRGIIMGIEIALEAKFGSEGLALMPLIDPLEDLALLKRIGNTLRSATSAEDIRRLLPASEPTAQG